MRSLAWRRPGREQRRASDKQPVRLHGVAVRRTRIPGLLYSTSGVSSCCSPTDSPIAYRFVSKLRGRAAIVEGAEEKGELELEQAYLDFLIDRRFNIRAGQLLVPLG